MQPSVFEQLSKELSSEERQAMLAKVRNAVSLTEDPVHDEIHQKDVNIEKIYSEYSTLQKLWVFILHLFLGKNTLEITEERELRELARQIKQQGDQWIDIENKRLKEKFSDLLGRLNNSLEPLRSVLSRCMQERDDFITSWAARHFSFDSKSLLESINPWLISEDSSNLRISRLRDTMQNQFSQYFETFPTELKSIFKQQSDALYHLNSLANYPFFRILSAFDLRGSSGNEAEWQDIKGPMMDLADIIFSFTLFPDSPVLEIMLIFANRENLFALTSEKSEEWLTEYLNKFTEVKQILSELSNFPFSPFLKIISEDLNYRMNNIGGSEDYFYIFKKQWQRKMEHQYSLFVNKYKIEELEKGLLGTWSHGSIKPIGLYNSSFSELGTFRYVTSFNLLNIFYQDLIKEKSYPCLDIIWKRGEFYKKNNAIQFKQVMEIVHQAPEAMDEFLEKLEETGFYGMRWKEIINVDDPNDDMYTKDIAYFYQSIDQEARELINQLISNLKLLANLLSGILLGDRGEFDTLSNYADLAGPPNRLFKDELVTREFLVNNAFKNLTDIVALEEKSPL